jgi:hypothetical protein
MRLGTQRHFDANSLTFRPEVAERTRSPVSAGECFDRSDHLVDRLPRERLVLTRPDFEQALLSAPWFRWLYWRWRRFGVAGRQSVFGPMELPWHPTLPGGADRTIQPGRDFRNFKPLPVDQD